MDIVLSQKSDKPIYTQIYEQIAAQIMNGELAAGEKLPPIRTVAVNLRISGKRNAAAEDLLGRDIKACREMGLSLEEILEIVKKSYSSLEV